MKYKYALLLGAPSALLAWAFIAGWGDDWRMFSFVVNVGSAWVFWALMLTRRDALVEAYSEGYRAGRLDSEKWLHEVNLMAAPEDDPVVDERHSAARKPNKNRRRTI